MTEDEIRTFISLGEKTYSVCDVLCLDFFACRSTGCPSDFFGGDPRNAIRRFTWAVGPACPRPSVCRRARAVDIGFLTFDFDWRPNRFNRCRGYRERFYATRSIGTRRIWRRERRPAIYTVITCHPALALCHPHIDDQERRSCEENRKSREMRLLASRNLSNIIFRKFLII